MAHFSCFCFFGLSKKCILSLQLLLSSDPQPLSGQSHALHDDGATRRSFQDASVRYKRLGFPQATRTWERAALRNGITLSGYLVMLWTGIPISIGVASSKTLAKIANRVAKSNSQHRSVFIYPRTEAKREAILKAIAVENIWGIGRQNSK